MDGHHILCPCFEWQVRVLVPRPHPLMSKNNLVKHTLLRQCNFISRLLMHLCTADEGTLVSKCPVLVTVSCYANNNLSVNNLNLYQCINEPFFNRTNLIGPYHLLGIGSQTVTLLARLFLTGRHTQARQRTLSTCSTSTPGQFASSSHTNMSEPSWRAALV